MCWLPQRAAAMQAPGVRGTEGPGPRLFTCFGQSMAPSPQRRLSRQLVPRELGVQGAVLLAAKAIILDSRVKLVFLLGAKIKRLEVILFPVSSREAPAWTPHLPGPRFLAHLQSSCCITLTLPQYWHLL